MTSCFRAPEGGSFIADGKTFWEKTQKEEKSSESDAAPSKEIRTLADEITAMEWQQFTQVKNQGGRASCQEDPYTLTLCAKASFIPGICRCWKVIRKI